MTHAVDPDPRCRLDALGRLLSTRDDALALLALGSLARSPEASDAWSDLDFFVLVREGAKARYLDDLSWLHAVHPLAWFYRNTVDGHKALMADGLVCEFAVFTPAELARIPFAPGRFVWRREEIPASFALPRVPLPSPAGRDWLVGEVLSNLLGGLQRLARGERLAAMRLIQGHALERLLELRAQASPASGAGSADPFDVTRRIEMRDPDTVGWLARAAGGYFGSGAAAVAILESLRTLAQVPEAVAARIDQLVTACDRPGTDA